MLDRKNDTPLYRQLEDLIQGKVEDGVWTAEQLIPSEAELIRQYGVSRTTVRQALGELVAAGVLRREQGRGTFVAAPKLEHPLTEASSFTDDILSRGHTSGGITLFAEDIMPSPRVAAKLQLRGPMSVVRLERIRTVDGEPVGLHTASLVRALVPSLDLEELRENDVSLYDVLQVRMGLPLREAVETLEAGIADERQARLLGAAKGSPILSIERVTYLANGRPIERTDMVYRADRYKSVIRVRVSQKSQ